MRIINKGVITRESTNPSMSRNGGDYEESTIFYSPVVGEYWIIYHTSCEMIEDEWEAVSCAKFFREWLRLKEEFPEQFSDYLDYEDFDIDQLSMMDDMAMWENSLYEREYGYEY